ncbi:hypothetical protein Phum_PHUM604530 [Pediculus humanus corporis]|uniref:Uncharacterized protein n=1 Tax=Pediculus humanus subsp. corporis TaxID=121224 RepID=E0W3G6_PEDHC|nr:uncharacterized protein Phum_PHUM604530 [Pediculus humanus corporis]EEB20172.1 hypothetical protein Phum_PHUM604530 [Pediculus humanus corporis]
MEIWNLNLIIIIIIIISTIKKSSAGEENDESVEILAELPLEELLAQKKNLEISEGDGDDDTPEALPLKMDKYPGGNLNYPPKIFLTPARKTIYAEDDESDEDKHVHEKKDKKVHDILNTSLTALSYLAFGGYLLSMIVNSLREKKRRIMMSHSAAMGNSNVQTFVTRKPIRVRFPITFGQGKRKKRSRPNNYYYYYDYDSNVEEDDFKIFNLMDENENF